MPTLAEKVEKLAARHKGRCLSMDKYVNEMSGLLWECSEGHQWLARFKDAQTHWCPKCPKKRNMFAELFCRHRHIKIDGKVDYPNE